MRDNYWQHFFSQEFLNEKLENYCWFVGIILLTFILKKPVSKLLARIFSKIAARFQYQHYKQKINEYLSTPVERLLQTVLFYVAANRISGALNSINFDKHFYIGKRVTIDFSLGELVDMVFLFLFILFVARVITRLLDFSFYLRLSSADAKKDQLEAQLLPLMNEILKMVVWTIAIFSVMGFVFHVNVPAIITGLGIGGVAIALASKETVENFFAAFTLLSDKPFITGDLIKAGDVEGVVEKIGFRSTRVRHSDGSAYIVPNQRLVSQNLVNLSNRSQRGVKLVLNVRYSTENKSLDGMVNALKNALEQHTPIVAPVSVYLDVFDKETLQVVVFYHLPHPLPDGKDLFQIKNEINILIHKTATQHAELGVKPV